MSLSEPDKVYELQEVMDNGMRVYKDEEDNTFFQQDLDSPLVSEADAGGRKAFMTKCDEKLRDWEGRAKKRMREGFGNLYPGLFCLAGFHGLQYHSGNCLNILICIQAVPPTYPQIQPLFLLPVGYLPFLFNLG